MLKSLVKELQFEDMSPGRQKRALRRFHLLQMFGTKEKLKGRKLLEALLLFTGHNGLLRIGELLGGLKVSDVLWDSNFLGFRLLLGVQKHVALGLVLMSHTVTKAQSVPSR